MYSSQAQFRYSLRLATVGALSTLLTYLLDIDFFGWMWMAITAFIVTDLSTGATIKQGISRATGTLAGAALGVCLAYLFNQFNLISIWLAFIFIGCISAIAYASNGKLRLVAMTSSVIYILASQPQTDAFTQHFWQIGFRRAADIILAITLSIIVSIFIFPDASLKKVIVHYQKTFRLYAAVITYLKDIINTSNQSESHKFVQQLSELENNNALVETRYENELLKQDHTAFVLLNDHIIDMRLPLTLLLGTEASLPQSLLSKLSDHLLPLLDNLQALFTTLSQKINHKNYLEKNLIDLTLFKQNYKTLLDSVETLRSENQMSNHSIAEVQNVYRLLSKLDLIRQSLERWQ